MLDFITRGAWEGRKPHPLFDPAFYLRKYPDVKMNPLAHYMKFGAVEGRQPHPLFDAKFYVSRNEDVRAARVNPLLHSVRNGASENRKPHPLFQPEYYFSRCHEAWLSRTNPLIYFLEKDATSPHPLFDCEAYRAAHPDAGNPLVDYVLRGESGSGESPFEIMDVAADLSLAAQRPFSKARARINWRRTAVRLMLPWRGGLRGNRRPSRCFRRRFRDRCGTLLRARAAARTDRRCRSSRRDLAGAGAAIKAFHIALLADFERGMNIHFQKVADAAAHFLAHGGIGRNSGNQRDHAIALSSSAAKPMRRTFSSRSSRLKPRPLLRCWRTTSPSSQFHFISARQSFS